MTRFISTSFLLFLLSAMILSCNPWESAKWVREGEAGMWSVELPSFLVPDSSLNADAVLQQHAVRKDFFIIVRKDSLRMLRDEEPDFVLEDFLDLSIERIVEQLSDPDVPDDTAFIISELPVHVATITGRYQSQSVRYRIAVIEGQDFLYQLLVWIPDEKTRQLAPYVDRVIESFRED